MTFFSMIGFTAPWLLVGLFALPLLWILLRAVPPAPIRRVFPGVALLLGLNDETVQADRTPWWLLLLRALVMACLIIGLAGPIVNPAPKGQNLSKLLVVLEGSWADASDWEAQQLAALEVVQQSGNQGRPVAFLQLTAPQKDLVFSAASEAARAIKAAEPNAWLPKRNWQGQFDSLGDFDTHWLASPIDWPGRDRLVRDLLRRGSVEVAMSRSSPIGLLPVRAAAQGIEISAVRMTAGQAQGVVVDILGLDPSGVERRLQSAEMGFSAQDLRATTAVDLPLEMRNRISRLVVAGHKSAAAVRLTDDRIQRPEIAILTGETSDREGLILFAPDHYLIQALSPVADLIDGTLDDVLLANPDAIILADVAKVASKEALADWVAEGGTLLRFAGPRLAAAQFEAQTRDPLLPVKLRAGKMCNPPPSRALEAVRVKGKAKPVVKGAGSKGKKADGVFDVWASKAPRARGVNKLARKLTAPTTNAKAVAPEHPGCSFNPPKDAREDVVAVALAKEFKAKQARYLDPVTVPVSNVVAEANLVNELYFESGFGEDETDDEDGDGDGKLSINPAVNADKYTRTKRNKLKRRAEAEAIEQANKKAKQLRRDLSNLKALNKEIEAEEEERKANLARRNAVRAERRASQPSRLGKLRHKEADADVRFADELDGGSLRTLKPGVSLLRDRLKSYERREIIEPRRKIERKKAKAVMKYEPGARGEKEIELMVAAEKSKQRISELRALVAAGDRGAS